MDLWWMVQTLPVTSVMDEEEEEDGDSPDDKIFGDARLALRFGEVDSMFEFSTQFQHTIYLNDEMEKFK